MTTPLRYQLPWWFHPFGMWWPDCLLWQTLKGFNQSSHSLLQATGLRVQRRTWTTLHLPTTMAAGLPSSPRRAWAWKHTSAFWTCGGLVPTVALRRQIWARLWFWLNDFIWSQRDSGSQSCSISITTLHLWSAPPENCWKLDSSQSNYTVIWRAVHVILVFSVIKDSITVKLHLATMLSKEFKNRRH